MGNLKLQLFAKSIEELAKEVIKGNYGNGEARKQALGSQYSEVQKVVNQMLNGTYKAASTNTNNNTAATASSTQKNTPKVSGVDSSVMETLNSTYTPDAETKKLETNVTNSANAYKEWASNTDIIDQSTLDALNKQWETPSSVIEADKFLAAQLEQIRSGRTSYTDQVEELFNKYMNREDFEYDVSEDQLFQQALASAMGSGKAAMQDTIGQASALTGGYGSTYATSAGNQAYNSFIEDAYNNLPEYYNLALQAYQAEGDEMLQQFNMAATLDAQEYGRLVDSYNAGVEERNWQYNTAFNEWSSSVNNAYNSANLQLQQNAQIGSNLYNTYLVDAETYQTKYAQGYQTWLDSVNSASTIASMQNSDYWNNTNLEYQKERDRIADNQWQQEYNLSAAKVSSSGGSGSGSGSGSGGDGDKEPTETQKKKALEAYNTGGEAALNQYVDSLPSNIDVGSIDTYINSYGQLPIEQRTFTKVEDTTNWLWGVDNDDVVQDQYGNKYKISDLKDLGKDFQLELTKLSKNSSYTKK